MEHSTRAVSVLAQQSDGMIFHQSMEAVEQERKELKLSTDSLLVITTVIPHANITARIPFQSLENFLFSVADLGYFTGSSTLHIDDKSLAYLENALKQKNRTKVLALSAAAKSTPSKLQIIETKDEIIEQQLINRAIDADVSYSTVQLTLFQNPFVRREVIANYVLSGYELPFYKGLGSAFQAGWQYFLGFILVLAHLWMFILLAFAVFVLYRYVQQKRKLFSMRTH